MKKINSSCDPRVRRDDKTVKVGEKINMLKVIRLSTVQLRAFCDGMHLSKNWNKGNYSIVAAVWQSTRVVAMVRYGDVPQTSGTL